MIGFLISAIKIIFLLGFLILIHEGGHFIAAKICKVKALEFAIGFGPTIWKKQSKETLYAIRLIPLGGFVNLEGEDNISDTKTSFSNASLPKRIAIIVAGAAVNIIFGLVLYFCIISFMYDAKFAVFQTKDFILEILNSLKQLFTGKAGIDQMTGPVGISNAVAKTTSIVDFLYLLSVISVSLGVTNLLPIPALDGGKLVFIIIEAIRRKKIKQEIEIKIQLIGFSFLMVLAILVTYKDIVRLL